MAAWLSLVFHTLYRAVAMAMATWTPKVLEV
jgi:hypothetical protein